MAYVRIAGVQGRHVVAVCRQAPILLSSIPHNYWTNIESGCFGSQDGVCYRQNQQQQRTYSTGRSAGSSWLRRKLYTVLAVVGLSGGGLILVSCCNHRGHQLELHNIELTTMLLTSLSTGVVIHTFS